ncbi:histidine kinase [Lutibacter sp. TH_r2]|uniref:tetratricopeptide repeat-containing sensor histidine kinase n=1 Tax=Lutibacter sp. TH_r2 TaxID=3082083 RepID=UPI0029544970|nr:histidine kinase [Lutibacter sp. TH_r2]MDV7187887.1 histidine kinase [Lutibacter sp. TH_r2]
MKFKSILFIIIVLFSVEVFTQEKESKQNTTTIYSDFVADENGNRLVDIEVSVQGTSKKTITDFNGRFTIEASIGDVIELSKDGVIINTYVYDGSIEYTVEDVSQYRSSKFKSKTIDQFNIEIDAAIKLKNTQPFKSIEHVEKALKSQTSKRGNTDKIAQAYEVLGDVYVNLKQYDLATDNYTTSLNSKSNNSVKLKLAKAYSYAKKYSESNSILSTILNGKMSSLEKVETYELLGNNYKSLKEFSVSESNYVKALALAKANKFTQKITDLNSKLAEVLTIQGKTSQAKNYLDSAISVSKNQSINKRAITNNSVANQYRDQQNFDKEIELKKETLKELEAANLEEVSVENDAEENISVQQLNLDIGNAYAKKKSFPKAIDYLEKSKNEADKVSDIETKKEAVEQLSELYKNVGDYKKALSNYQEYVALVDVLYKKKEKEIEDAVALSKSLSEKQNRINSLEKDRELNESQYKLYETEQQVTVENYKRQRLIIYSLIGGLLLLLAAIYFMYKSNKQRRLANNLLALKSLRSQMNPHFIFNALNSVNSFIAQNDERSANRYLTEFSTLMRNVLNNSEQDFIPLSKEIELLELYMKLEHARFKDKFDYSINIDENLTINEYQIPPMLLQPYVENAVWHGLRYKEEKGFLKVSFIKKNEESIVIEISDNGIGRTKSKALKTENQQKQQSKGMANIKKRVAILNEMYSDKVDVFIEDLYIDTSGTKVILTLKKE